MKSHLPKAAFLLLVSVLPAFAANAPSGQDLLRQGRLDDAVIALRRQLAAGPANSAEIYNALCRADLMISKFDSAIQNCEKAVSLSPSDSKYHLWLGRAYGEKAEKSSWFTALGLARKTRDQFEKAVQLDGNNSNARADLAEFYIEAPSFLGGGTDKALAQAEAMEKVNASVAHWVKARVAERANNASNAEQEFKAANVGGNKPEAFIDLASFYRRQKRFAQMDEAIRQALNAQRKPGAAALEAANIYLRSERGLPQAAQMLAKYISDGDFVEEAPLFRAHYLLGQIKEKQGDISGAAKEYEAALSLSKEFSEARDALNRVRR